MKKVVFTGGGTGGHVYPNLAIIAEIKNKAEIYYIGSNGMEKEIVKRANIPYYEIKTCKFKRNFSFSNFLIPFKLLSSIKHAKKILKQLKPDVIFSKGGYVSLPVVIAGYFLKIKVISHESDLTLGLANKICLKFSQIMCTSFEQTAKNLGKKGVFTGSPLRKELLHGNKYNALKLFKKYNGNPTVLIIGGSSGSKNINKLIFESIKKLKNYNIIHLVGKNNINKELLNFDNYIQLEFSNNMQDLYALADIIISRAGSNVINEILALKKPNILIPLSKQASRGDQILNAEYFKELGYSYVLHEEDLSTSVLIKAISEVLKNKNLYINNMKKSKNILANEKILDLLLK